MAKERIILTKQESVAYLTLENPAERNRLSPDMAESLVEYCHGLNQEEEVHLVVIIGAGETFSCGAEVPQIGDRLPRGACALADLRKASIAAINGDAIDQGLELALACDIRVGVSGARLGMTHLRRGLLPWDGGTQRLPRVVGRAWALDLLLTSRLIDTTEALGMGLVHRVVGQAGLMGAVEEIAKEILQGSPLASAYAKEAMQKGMDLSMEQGLSLETDLNLMLHTTSDRDEGIRSFFEHRRPNFKGE